MAALRVVLLGALGGAALIACNIIVVSDYPGGRGWGDTSTGGEGGAGGPGGGGGSAQWPTVCLGSCHGGVNGNPAPPLGDHGETDPSAPAVGAHQDHYAASSWHMAVPCTECHVLPTSTKCPDPEGKDPTHCNNQVDLVWGPLSRLEVAGAPSFSGAPGYACTNTYCHGATLEPDGIGVSLKAPVWNVVDGTQDACGTSCHTNPPGGTHPTGDACASCHAAVIASYSAGPPAQATWADPTKHINGINESNAAQ
jgi:predicted CxxxxCH...CXXCH cytochrome family protein